MGVLGLWQIIEKAGARAHDGDGDADEAAGGGAATRTSSLLLAAQRRQQQAQQTQQCAAASSAAATVAPVAQAAVVPCPSPSPRSPRVLAVDLSVWLMEAHAISKGIQHAQQHGSSGAHATSGGYAGAGVGAAYVAPRKHYLTYLLTRVSSFLRNNIRLIFVTDGRAPTLKARLTTKENQVGGSGNGGGGGANSGAGVPAAPSHRPKQNALFMAQIRDCTRLLRLMDLPVLELELGEAEALCGALNARGACDGVLTTDGDAFLFGARSVLKNLEATSTQLQATVVDMRSIQSQTGLDRHKLILLALLLGSDYTSGVRSLGPHKAVQFIRLLDSCAQQMPLDSPGAAGRGHAIGDDHPTVRLFRAVMGAESAEAAIQLLLARYAPSVTLASSSVTASSAGGASTSAHSSSPSLDFNSLTLAELKAEMTRRGLKPQSKTAMIAKLQHMAALSPSLLLSQSAEVESSDDENGDGPIGAIAPNRGASSSRSLVRVHSFLRTNVPKIHARYHANLAEMELVLQSYLRPNLKPSVDVLEKQLHSRIPHANFLELRSYLADECQLPFVKFERSWLPVELHLDLWRRQHALHMERMRLDAIAAFQDDDGGDEAQEDDDDLVVLSPPNRSSSTQPAAHSSSSTGSAPQSVSSSSPGSTAPVAHYTPSHICKRRVIQGAPYVVVIWTKTPAGYKEIASLPKHMQTDATTRAATGSGNPADDDEDEEIDMTAPAESAAAAVSSPPMPTAAAAGAVSTSVASGPSKRHPVQDTDLALYETYEPTWFAQESVPDLVARFEGEETAQAQRKLQAKADKVAARTNKPARSDPAAAALPKAGAKPRARSKKLVADPHTPSISTFLSPIPTAAKEADSVPASSAAAATTAAASASDTLIPALGSKRSLQDALPSPPSAMIPAAADGSYPSIPPSQSGTLSRLAASAPTLFAALMQSAQADGSPATHATAASAPPSTTSSAVLALSVKQSSMHSFVRFSKLTANLRQPPTRADLLSKQKSGVVALTPPVAPPAPSSPLVTARSPSSSPPRRPRAPSPPLSSLLATCPMCGSGFPSRFLESHVNSCLDEQQQMEDEKMAAEMQRAMAGGVAVPPPPSPPSAAAHPIQRSDYSHSGDRDANRSPRSSSPSPPPARQRVAKALTPQKRKTHASVREVDGAPTHDGLAPEPNMLARARNAPAPPALTPASSASSATAPALRGDFSSVGVALASSSSARTLIDLMDSDSDDECPADLHVGMNDDEDDDQPGSTIYCRAPAAAPALAASNLSVTSAH